MVDTREGHGVLHAVLAFPPGVGEWLSFRLIGEWWQEIHGARQVKFVRIKDGDGSVRRLSGYIVSQYMVSQGEVEDLLGRISGTRFSVPLKAWRDALRKLITGRWRAYQWVHDSGVSPEHRDGLYAELRRLQWRVFRSCWDDLLRQGWFRAWDETWVVEFGAIVPL
jgi:hypothetical protein